MISEFKKEKVFWTKKMNLKLVKFMKGRPNIWNPQHPKYTTIADRDRTYAEFAAKYGNQFTGQAVKDRWTNIRSTFTHYLRKIHKSRSKSDGEEYIVNWPLWEPCQYLLKVSKGFKSSSLDVNECDEESKSDETDSRLEEKDNFINDCITESDTTTNLNCKGIAKNLVNVFKGVQNDAFGLENTKHGRIGKAVTEKLSQLNSFEAGKIAQNILNILMKYDEHNPVNPNNLKVEFE